MSPLDLVLNDFHHDVGLTSCEFHTLTYSVCPLFKILLSPQLEDQCPRYIVLYWKFEKDEREAFSVILVHYCPRGSPPQSNMLMSRSKQQLIDFFRPNRILEVRDAEDLTDEYLRESLMKN